jgi:NAD+ diphosphatase
MPLTTFFSGGRVVRSNTVREDAIALQQAWHDSATRFVAVWDSRCAVRDDRAMLLTLDEIGMDARLADSIYLGQQDATHLFAVALPDELTGDALDAGWFGNFRGLMSGLDSADAALLAYAKGMVEWHRRHQHCGVCGAPNKVQRGGFAMDCSDEGCGQRSFPRIDPAIIVLVTDGERCLLGRQTTWPEGRYSTLAGFVEPGESLEDAVRREVKEESNIDVAVDDVAYLGSQPWPFPTALMIGFHASASSLDIRLNDGELADAGWYTRAEIASGTIVLPPSSSIAFRLIAHWFDQATGPQLETLELSGSFSSSSGQRS